LKTHYLGRVVDIEAREAEEAAEQAAWQAEAATLAGPEAEEPAPTDQQEQL